ncbi:hypothetical protein CCP3SC15_710002 [Gammaproteobacteria bacterium]
MQYILDTTNQIVGTGDGTAPLAGGLRYVEQTPELDAQYADLTATIPPPPPTAFEVSKLALRRALRALGLEPALNAFLAANPTAKADWDDSTILRTDDPLLVAAMPALCQQAGITSGQATALLESCRA